MAFPEGSIESLTPGQVAHIEAGGSVWMEDAAGIKRPITRETLGSLGPVQGSGLAVELAKANARIAELESHLAEVQAEAAPMVGVSDGLSELLKALLPTSQTEVKGLSKVKLALVAKYAGVETEGKEDEAVRAEVLAALKPQEGQ